MIKISDAHIETPMLLDSDSPLVLSIENSKEFYYFATELEKAFLGEESDVSFWKDTERVSAEISGEIILSPFYFDMSDKKIVNLLYKRLVKNYNDGSFIVKFGEICSETESFLYDLISTVDFAVEQTPFSIEDLLKLCSVKPTKTYDTLLEKLICYINIFAELKSVSFFVLVGFKDVLTPEETTLLYKHCALNKIELFLLERKSYEKLPDNERKIIITEDLCEIVENIPEMY